MEAQVSTGRAQNCRVFHANDGWHYNFRERRGNRLRLKCRHYRKGCIGTAVIDIQTRRLRHLGGHNHPPDDLLIQELQMRRDIIAVASNNLTGISNQQLLHDWKTRCQNPDLARRFTRARMRSSMYEASSANYPKIPATLLFLGILLGLPDMTPVCRTLDQTDFIFRGIVGVEELGTVALVFVYGRMLHFLQSRKSLHGDGTFKKRPRKPNCSQIYNIVTRYGTTTVIGIVRVLMSRRTEAAYTALFQYLKMLAPTLRPRRIHCDFERAQMNAWRTCFPLNSLMVGCLWHYAVACSRYARSLGLAAICKTNRLVDTYVRCLCAAPLLPSDLIHVGVEEIWSEVEASAWSNELQPLFDYFETEWLPRVADLSVYKMPERTNNCSESDNRSMANTIPQNRPNIWHLIGAFVRMEYLAWQDKLAVDEERQVVGPRKYATVGNDQRIQRYTLMLDNEDITPGEFLHRVSYSILAAVDYGLDLNDDSSTEEDSESDSD